MRSNIFLLISSVVVTLSLQAAPGQALFNVMDYGAKGDGQQLDTPAISKAIEACANNGGGTVYFPPGRYLTGTVVLKSHVAVEVDSGATILGSPNEADYPVLEDPWDSNQKVLAPLFYAEHAENITLTGRGTIDGQGQIWWKRFRLASPKRGMTGAKTPEQIAEAKKVEFGRPRLIRFVHCHDVVVEHLLLTNSPFWTVSPLFCDFVRVDGLTIQNPVPSPNTDGINPESCRNVQIINCRIDVGDDCVTLKSGLNELGRKMGIPDENITIANCVMMRGHGGVAIGSEMSGGVKNVTVANCVFQGTDIGLRVKSQRGRGGVVENFTACNITMENVAHPIVVTTFYQGKDKPTDQYEINEGTPQFHDFLFNNIAARGATDAGSITGLRELPVGDIVLSNIRISAKKGFTCTNAKHVSFNDVEINPEEGPALRLRNSSDIDSTRLHSSTLAAGASLVQAEDAN